MVIHDFCPYRGENCEISVIGNLLSHRGVKLSEPMLFGIGEGLGFLFWDSKQLGYPLFLGRCKQDVLTENIVKSLGLRFEVSETSSKERAWDFVKTKIDRGIPVGLKLDCYYLDYFSKKIHFPAHYVTMYGYDDTDGYLADTPQQGLLVKTSLASITKARSARGPMSSRNRAYSLTEPAEMPNLKYIVMDAIHRNAKAFLNPPISNANANGIRKTAKQIGNWLNRPEMTPEIIVRTGLLMEKAGTGGALFRNIYRDFLKESSRLYPELGLQDFFEMFSTIAPMWTEVSFLICCAGKNSDAKSLFKAAEILNDIAVMEETAMKGLLNITSKKG